MIEWKDETSYSRSDTGRVPRTWVARICGLRVTVSRNIHHAPDAWLLTCAPWFDTKELTVKDGEMAKLQALEWIEQRLRGALLELGA